MIHNNQWLNPAYAEKRKRIETQIAAVFLEEEKAQAADRVYGLR